MIDISSTEDYFTIFVGLQCKMHGIKTSGKAFLTYVQHLGK